MTRQLRQSLRDRLAARSQLFGLMLSDPSPALVELAGHLGYDWVFIDQESGPFDLEVCENMVRAAETADIIPIVRLPLPDPAVCNRYLDIGAMGVMVPHLDSARLAREIVDACKFAPLGHRGANSRARAAYYGQLISKSDYASWANAQTMVFGLLEGTAVFGAIDELLAIDGLDGFVIGPGDLAHSMGHPGEIDHPEVTAAVEALATKILASSKILCLPLANPATARADAVRLTKVGVRMLFETSTHVFARGANEVLSLRPAGGDVR